MLKLLSVNFRRAFLRKRFIIGGGFPIFIGILMLFLAYKNNGHVDNMPFMMSGLLPMLIGITAGLYISQDYTNNTIRNKIICGHSRTMIYLSNLVTSMLGTIIIYGVYVLVTLGIGKLIVGVSSDFDMELTIKGILLTFCIFLTFTSLTVMFCMMMSGVSGTVVSAMLYIILGMLMLPVLFISNDTINEWMMNLNPSFQIDNVEAYVRNSELMPVEDYIHISWIPISSLVMIILSTVLGISVFNKKDIK
ncbi:MAG: ABC transporter permease subunit [Ruminococcus sp.]|nr:ABC transporter permease subunit [Ruminococcus sp.]